MNEVVAATEVAKAQKGAALARVRAVWRRRRWLGLLVFALPFAAAVTAVLSLPSLYRSTATVLVERQQVPDGLVKSTVTSELETRLQTISQEILSRSKLESLIERFGLYRDLREQEASSEEIVERMRRDITFEVRSAQARGRQADTVAFALGYRGRDPQTVALVANALASFYIEENLKASERQAAGTTEFLKAQLADTRKRLDEQEHRVSEFRRRHLGELPQQLQANLQTVDMLNNQLRLASDNQVRAAERRVAIATQLAEAESFGGASVTGAPANGSQTLAPDSHPARLARLRQELTAARSRYTDAHPTVIRLKEEIASVESEFAGMPAQTAEDPAASAAAGPPNPYVLKLRDALREADAELKVAKVEEQRLRAAIGAYRSRVENTPRREQELLDISRDYEAAKEVHQSLLKRYEEAQLAENMEQPQKGEQFRVLDPALPSALTAAPNRNRLLLVALMLCLSLGVAALCLAEAIDSSFHSADDLRAFTRAPLIVRISRITTPADRRWRRVRAQLATAAVLIALALVASLSYAVAHGNEQLVRMLDRGAQT
jgi:polysaccharide chain length determinant protein (PEP-CTERM system associated)